MIFDSFRNFFETFRYFFDAFRCFSNNKTLRLTRFLRDPHVIATEPRSAGPISGPAASSAGQLSWPAQRGSSAAQLSAQPIRAAQLEL